ncbi:MAG: serine/threonine-protein kinase [Phycisphaerae bacterium]|nr:serine/threonine-protein kinase [Phycisphaerae bacterium]
MNEPAADLHWERAKLLFGQSARLPAKERASFLRDACADDGDLLREIEELLELDATPTPLDDGAAVALGFGIADDHRATSTASPPAWCAPARIGPFQLRGVLGQGTSGIVYRAESQASGTKVAVKILRPGEASRVAIRRFRLEPEILAQLDHPGIARVLLTGTLPQPDGRPYFVTEYVDGQSVTAYARERTLSVLERVALVAKICDRVQHAHGRAVLHRDVKPANILITKTGQPKLLDFGVARMLHPAGERATLATGLSQVVGTLVYMAPEQLRHTGDCDVRSDIYSLAAILYELLAGRTPRSIDELLHVSRGVERIGSLVPECRGDLDRVVHKALHDDPAQRYASVTDFAHDLTRVVRGEPTSGRAPSLLYECRRLVRHHPLPSIVGAASLATIIGILTWLGFARAQAERNLKTTSATVEVLIDEMLERASPLSGTRESRQRAIEYVAPLIDRLAESQPDRVSFAFHKGRLLIEQSDLAYESGRLPDALQLRSEALAAFNAVSEQQPQNLRWRAARSIALVKVGDMRSAIEGFAEAEPYYLEALELDESLIVADAANLRWADQIVWSYLRMSRCVQRSGDPALAHDYSRRAVEASERLFTLDPTRPGSTYALLCALHQFSSLEVGLTGDPRPAEYWTRALALGEQLVLMAPDNRGYQAQRVRDLLDCGSECMRRYGLQAAEQFLALADRAIGEYERRNPGDVVGSTLAADFASTRARGLSAMGATEEAAAYYRTAIASARESLERHPMNVEVILDFVNHVHAADQPLRSAGDFEAAQGARQEAIERLQAFLHHAPQAEECARSLASLRAMPAADTVCE